MKIIENIKAHPYLTAGGVFVGGVILVIAMSGGSKSETVTTADNMALGGYTPTGTDTASNNMLAQTQIAGQIASRVSDNELKASENNNATAYMLAAKKFEVENNANIITGQVATANIAADVAINASNNGVSTAAINADLDKVKVAYNSANVIALGAYDRDKYVMDKSAQVQSLKITSEADVAKLVSNNTSPVAIANINAELSRYLNDHSPPPATVTAAPVSAPATAAKSGYSYQDFLGTIGKKYTASVQNKGVVTGQTLLDRNWDANDATRAYADYSAAGGRWVA